MSAPFSRTLLARARLTSGLTVLMSTKTLSGPSPASNPSGPSATAARAAELVTIANVTSDAEATSRGDDAQRIPLSISHCALGRVRLYPVTVWPLLSRRATISPPIVPSPTNPRIAILSVPRQLQFRNDRRIKGEPIILLYVGRPMLHCKDST